MEQVKDPTLEKAHTENDKNSMDPLKLPEPCTQAIMKYLTAKELLKAIEVSKYWKEFIESRNFLMNRVMNNIVVKPSIKDCSRSLINNLFNDNNARTAYKHMRSLLQVDREFEHTKITICPMNYFASTLETLLVDRKCMSYKDYLAKRDESYESIEFKNCDYPKLRMADLGEAWNSFKDSSFKVLTHLRIKIDPDPNSMIFKEFDLDLSRCRN